MDARLLVSFTRQTLANCVAISKEGLKAANLLAVRGSVGIVLGVEKGGLQI